MLALPCCKNATIPALLIPICLPIPVALCLSIAAKASAKSIAYCSVVFIAPLASVTDGSKPFSINSFNAPLPFTAASIIQSFKSAKISPISSACTPAFCAAPCQACNCSMFTPSDFDKRSTCVISSVNCCTNAPEASAPTAGITAPTSNSFNPPFTVSTVLCMPFSTSFVSSPSAIKKRSITLPCAIAFRLLVCAVFVYVVYIDYFVQV